MSKKLKSIKLTVIPQIHDMNNIIEKSEDIGDKHYDSFIRTGNKQEARDAIKAYTAAIRSCIIELVKVRDLNGNTEDVKAYITDKRE